jgi:hypothetical protein|tara:strand:- start:25 stop:1167 length:1143 start_codon:yes stop_codon:yes gene_type:complete
MYMPRLSLYKPQKGNDYNFIDKQILEMFTVGGTDLHLHKYLGAENPSEEDATADQPRYDAVKETNIQDMLFLENRDRKYDPDVYTMRGIYNVSDIDFNLSQFGLFLSNDTLMLTVHINSSVKTVGRKIISGDVIELPHLKDEYALNDYSVALKRFYVVEEVNRASEGFSQTWYPHLYRLKLKQIVDSQEFKEILDLPAEEDAPGGNTLRDLLSTYDKEMQINNAIVNQAEADASQAGYDTSHYFTLALDANGNTALVDTDADGIPDTMVQPEREGYNGYLLGDGIPTNGAAFGHGISFPGEPQNDDFFLRTDFSPNRLFRFDNTRWVKQEDNVRMTLTNTNDRTTQKGTFVNNTTSSTIAGEAVVERQSLSKALRPKADE